MLGKIFWGMVILLFIGILVIPFILPSYYARQAEVEYYNEYQGNRGSNGGIHFNRSRKKHSSRSVRSSGGYRSYRSGK